MMPRALVLLGVLASLGAAPAARSPQEALQRGVAYLMDVQDADGGWHSQTYGALRPGAAVTATALYAMSHVPKETSEPFRNQLARGFAFLQPGIEKKGYVANDDGSPDFPSYGSAMLLVAARRLELKMSNAQRSQLIDYLVSAQLTETRMFGPDNPHHGGWDLMGAQRIQGQTSGTNVSLGRFVLEALRECDEPDVNEARTRALRWINGCQNLPGDGGFFFTPDKKSESNKADRLEDLNDERRKGPRSYGTTTCDGLACLIFAGAQADDRRVQAAVKWLMNHPKLDAVPGFEDLPDELGWQQGLRYYYYAGLAKTLQYLPEAERNKRRKGLLTLLVQRQRADGSWQNESARMREDDPLICTSLALIAMGELLSHE